MSKSALICGVSGQDGALLSKFLLNKGYKVLGTSRDAQTSSFANLKKLGIHDQVQTLSLAPNDFRSVLQVISKHTPDEIYNLSGQSSVGLSFEQPVETMESISTATLNFLEAIRFSGGKTKFYNAGSSECFGDNGNIPADEKTPFRPRSPYAVAKATAFWHVAIYREAYNLKSCTGILFNHESHLRPERFVTAKIISAVKRISKGSKEKLQLGNLAISRDWGLASEYVEAMWLMLQQDQFEDIVIGTGETNSLEDFVSYAFSKFGLNWKDHVNHDPNLMRPSDLHFSKSNPSLAETKLKWKPKSKMRNVIDTLLAE